ncbi:conserved hypothetical protein [Hyella patelloides LEGE 07179]|uniref:Uncharacterized protein n=1 Tax=Hyella patelloides LEGE 07179 TaxID=945734 RepID=A0A563VUK1_9CYAN|nr:hypothetical protein [Hyella patelloides]VEP15152.1 conserved hypothetical protein [Hyella patelloides LEGE 07179]
MKSQNKHFTKKASHLPRSQVRKSRQHFRNYSETEMIAETSFKLFLSLLISLVALISLSRLIPYHFAQSAKLKELRAQVQETEHRVDIKRQELQKNFDSWQIENLMEEQSPRIAKNRIRVFWRNNDQKE